MVRVPISWATLHILQAVGQARHVETNGDRIVLPISIEMFRECCKQQRPDETIEDVIVRAITNSLSDLQ